VQRFANGFCFGLINDTSVILISRGVTLDDDTAWMDSLVNGCLGYVDSDLDLKCLPEGDV